MATLKSIKNKYLVASDGAVLGVDANTENISALSFKLSTADSLTKFNMVDGFSDDYNDATGVDAATSTNDSRDSTGKYYSGTGSVTATGGTITTDGAYTVHKFLLADTGTNFTTDTAQDVEYLVVAGGGGSGCQRHNGGGSGGGGAGGLRTNMATVVNLNLFTVANMLPACC